MSAARLMGYNPEIRTWLEARKPQAKYFNQLTIEAALEIYRRHGFTGSDLAHDLVDARDKGDISFFTGRYFHLLPPHVQKVAVEINEIQSAAHPNSDTAHLFREGYITPYAFYSLRHPEGVKFGHAP